MAVKKLKRDLINGPFHCFGRHDQCSSDFLSTAREEQESSQSDGSPESDDEDREARQESSQSGGHGSNEDGKEDEQTVGSNDLLGKTCN